MDRYKIHETKMLALKGAWVAACAEENYILHLRQLHIEQIREIAEDAHIGINHVRIVAIGPGGRCCAACTAMNGKVLSLKMEQLLPTLPLAGCTCTAYNDRQFGFCLCYYEPVFDDELEI